MQTEKGQISQVSIARDKRGYPHNIFLVYLQVSASNEYPQHMFSWTNKKNICFSVEKKMPYLELCKSAIESVCFFLKNSIRLTRKNYPTVYGRAFAVCICTEDTFSHGLAYMDSP